MSNIHKLPGVPLPEGVVVESVVELLEELLTKAKAGEITSVAVAYTNHTDSAYTRWAHNYQWWKLVGCVAQLKFRMLE